MQPDNQNLETSLRGPRAWSRARVDIGLGCGEISAASMDHIIFGGRRYEIRKFEYYTGNAVVYCEE